jgi:hypothetical protein
MAREQRTLAAMVRIHCRGRHRSEGPAGEVPCAACRDLIAFAGFRLRRCPHGDLKPTCARCPIHCYLPARREQVREVMRYAGPRMLLRHPVLALRHWLDGFREVPAGRPRVPRPSNAG